MRRGRFERSWGSDGRQVFRVRWDEQPAPLSGEELRRLEFLRYLLETGRVSETPPQA